MMIFDYERLMMNHGWGCMAMNDHHVRVMVMMVSMMMVVVVTIHFFAKNVQCRLMEGVYFEVVQAVVNA